MAKMFYSFEEAQAKTGKSAEDLQKLVDDGTLRVFRDGSKIMFKIEDVDRLAGEGSSGEIMELSAVDAKSESDTFTLDTVPEKISEDAAAPETALSSAGIIEFDVDDLDFGEVADPASKTQIAPSVAEEVVLEGSGSGSGLLELTKESDDTSLGAELLDEIYPGDEAPTAVEGLTTVAPAGEAVEQPVYMAAGAPAAAATVIEAKDPAEMPFAAVLALGVVIMVLMGLTIGGMIGGIVPEAVAWMQGNMAVYAICTLLVVIVLAVVGVVMASSAARRQAAAARYY